MATPPRPDAHAAPSGRLLTGLSLLAIAGSAALGLWPWSPAPAPATVSTRDFSAERAAEHLPVIAAEPHPVGSPHHAAVLQYLVTTLRRLQLEVTVQEARSRYVNYADGSAIELRNILARRKGTDSTGTIIVAAHYDSRAEAPGAADDGAAVAAILETLRALDESPPLRNDLLVTITDGEEMGLLGAHELPQHPWFPGAGVVLNFEARGCRGPSMMFETSVPDGWVVEQFAAAAPAPIANSLMAGVYRRMPHDTDFTVFRLAGFTGLNFAFIGGHEAYHTHLDTVENLDPRSLQHHGSYMLALTRHFAALDLRAPRGTSQSIYFNPIGTWLVIYPRTWMWPLTGIATALLMLGMGLAAARGQIRLRALLVAAAAFVATLGLATVTAYLISSVILQLASDPETLGAYRTLHDEIFFGGLALLSTALTTGCLRWIDRRAGTLALTAAVLTVWCGLLWTTCVLLPGGSFLFTWPLLTGALALVCRAWLFPLGSGAGPGTAVGLAASLPVVPLLAFSIHAFFQGMMLAHAAVGIPLLILLLGLLWPLLRAPSRALLWTTALAGLAVVAVGIALCH